MLRSLVALLVLANAGFFAWHAGWLDPMLGTRATPGREPHRLQEQVHPERLIVLGVSGAQPMLALSRPTATEMPPAASSVSPSEPSASDALAVASCQEAGPFTADEQRQVQLVLSKALPANQWSTQTVAVPGLWLVYMGPYPDADTLQRKQLELRRIRNLSFEEVRSPASLRMGLSLGRFNVEAQALAALESMKLRGVRTAKVVNLRPPMDLNVVRVPQVSADQSRRLSTLPLPAGKGFVPCENR